VKRWYKKLYKSAAYILMYISHTRLWHRSKWKSKINSHVRVSINTYIHVIIIIIILFLFFTINIRFAYTIMIVKRYFWYFLKLWVYFLFFVFLVINKAQRTQNEISFDLFKNERDDVLRKT